MCEESRRKGIGERGVVDAVDVHIVKDLVGSWISIDRKMMQFQLTFHCKGLSDSMIEAIP